MSELIDWAKANSPWLRMIDGEEVVVKYTGHEFIPDAFDPTKKKVRYLLEIEDGSVKFWDTGSGKTAFFFGALKEGAYVKISASGEGLKRRYELDQVKDADGKELKEIADDVEEVDPDDVKV
jgi:hypothetical protein